MTDIVKIHNLFINSSIRSNGTSNSFTIYLRSPLILLNRNNFFRLKCGRVCIPNIFNQINSNNSTLSVTIFRPSVPFNLTANITLATGNYSITSLLSELSIKLSALAASNSITLKTNFNYTKTTGKVDLSVTAQDALATTITLNFISNKTLGAFFGYTQNAVFSYTTTSYSNQYVNVNPITNILIRCSLPQRESYEYIVDNGVETDIIAKVPIGNYSSGNYIFYENSISYCDLASQTIDTLDIYLTDNLSYSIDMNLEWSLVLTIEEIGINKQDEVLDFEILAKKEEHDVLLKELEYLRTLVNQTK
jgi:hypothetical protein